MATRSVNAGPVFGEPYQRHNRAHNDLVWHLPYFGHMSKKAQAEAIARTLSEFLHASLKEHRAKVISLEKIERNSWIIVLGNLESFQTEVPLVQIRTTAASHGLFHRELIFRIMPQESGSNLDLLEAKMEGFVCNLSHYSKTGLMDLVDLARKNAQAKLQELQRGRMSV